jgi:hypothetical protein
MLIAQAGCTPPSNDPTEPIDPNSNLLSVYTQYMADDIDIMPLTGFIVAETIDQKSRIEAYVSLLDASGSQIKAPGVFRFEVYKHVVNSPEPKGKRIAIFADVDLKDSNRNNDYWQDYLRAYKFQLDFEPEPTINYILQATCICPSGKRLSTDFILKNTP